MTYLENQVVSLIKCLYWVNFTSQLFNFKFLKSEFDIISVNLIIFRFPRAWYIFKVLIGWSQFYGWFQFPFCFHYSLLFCWDFSLAVTLFPGVIMRSALFIIFIFHLALGKNLLWKLEFHACCLIVKIISLFYLTYPSKVSRPLRHIRKSSLNSKMKF